MDGWMRPDRGQRRLTGQTGQMTKTGGVLPLSLTLRTTFLERHSRRSFLLCRLSSLGRCRPLGGSGGGSVCLSLSLCVYELSG